MLKGNHEDRLWNLTAEKSTLNKVIYESVMRVWHLVCDNWILNKKCERSTTSHGRSVDGWRRYLWL